MRQRHLVSAAALTVAASLALAGCAGGNSGGGETTDPDKPVTLVVQQQTGSEAIFELFKKGFEDENPNVTVDLQTISQDAKTSTNLSVIASSDPPDVAMIPLNSEVYTQLISANALAPIEDVWANQNLDERLGEGVANSLKVNGKPYTVVYAPVYYDVVWLNSDILKEVGLEVPADRRFASVDDFITFMKKLKDAGKAGFAVGGASGYQLSWMIDALLPSASTAEEIQNYLQSPDPTVEQTVKYTDEPFVKTLETLQEFNDAGIFTEGFLGQDVPTASAPFLSGTGGAALGLNADTLQFEKNNLPLEKLDWAFMPPVDGGNDVVTSQYFGDGLGIPATAKNPGWAKKFLEYVMSSQSQAVNVVGTGNIPATNDVAVDALTELPETTQQMLADNAENPGQPGWTSTVPAAVGQKFMEPLIQKMFLGELTPQEVAEKMQAQIEDYRANAEK